MKIKAISRSHTADQQTAFITDPPLTPEIFNCALKNYIGAQNVTEYWEDNGLFVVAQTEFPPDQIQTYENWLTSAENLLKQKQGTAENAHEKLLQDRAKHAGLPLA